MDNQPEQRERGPTASGRSEDRSGKEQVVFVLRLALVLGMVSAYAVGFSPLYRLTGSGMWAALAILPVIAAAWFWGLRPALLAALLCSLLSGLLVSLVQPSHWGVVGQALLVSVAAYFPAGAVVGRLHDLGERLRDQISERKQVEEALAQEQYLLRTLLDNIPDAIYFKDTESRFIRTNRAHAERWFGLSDPAQAVGKTDSDFFSEEHARKAYEDEQEIIRTGQPLMSMEERETWPDRPDTWVLTSKMPLRDEEGEIIGTFGITRDITKRKRAEEALRESEEKYRNVVERANDGIVIIQDAIVRYGNPRLAEMWGATLQELIGTPFADHVHPDELPRVVDRYKRRMAGEDVTPIYETILSRKDGTKLYAELNAGIITYQGNPADLVIVRDITERRRAEEALAAERNLLRTLIDNLPDYIFVKDAESRFITTNAAHFRTFNNVRSLDEVVGKTDFDLFPRELAERYYADERQVISSGEPLVDRQELALDQHGHEQWLLTTKVPLRDPTGSVVGLMGIARDITERKRAEEQLSRYTAELERANQELRDFTYIVSHDLRAPLINLKGFAGELRQALGMVRDAMEVAAPHLGTEQRQAVTRALQEDVPEALEFIDASATRMDQFIGALLKLSRLGRRDLSLTRIDMNALVEDTLQTLAHQVEEGQVRVTVAPLPQVVADRTSMEQIMGNLLSNAVQYLDRDRPGEIEISGERGHEETTFRVRDNGRGIAEHDMDKVFAPFRRAGRQDRPGEGMALAYVRALIRRHGGDIWCESELGVGTTFTFTIPNQLEKGGNHE